MKFIFGTVVFSASILLVQTVAFATPHLGGYNNLGTSYSITSSYCDITTPNYPVVYSNSASAAYNMLTASDTVGSHNIVQVGWYKASNQGLVPDGVHYFSEYQDTVVWNAYGSASNTTHGYRISVLGGYYYCYADDALIALWPVGFTATGYEFSEELNGNSPYNAQFAGQASSHARFANVRIFANGSTNYSPYMNRIPDSNGVASWSNYVLNQSSSTFDLWDARY